MSWKLLSALASKLEVRGVYDAETKLKKALRRIVISSTILTVLAYITGYYILLALVAIAGLLFFLGIFASGRDYNLINREAILFVVHGFILAYAGFDITAIFDRLAKMEEYEGSYIFRRIMGYFYFTGMDLKSAINKVIQEEERLGVSFKTFLTGVYSGLMTGTDPKSMFSMIIQQALMESQRDIERFSDFISSFLSGLMPVVIMLPLLTVLLGGVANLGLPESLFLNIGLGLMMALIFLFSENKFLYYPESIMLNPKALFLQSTAAIAVGFGLYPLIGTPSLFLAALTFFIVGYYSTRKYIGVRKDVYSFLPAFLADLGERIGIGQTFAEAATSMSLDVYGEFSRVLKYSIGNLLMIGDIPWKKEYDGIFAYRMYKKLIMDLHRGTYGYEALANIRSIISLMSTVYDRVRWTLTTYSFIIAISLSLGMLFVDFLSFIGTKVAQSLVNVGQAAGSMSGMLALLSFLSVKGWAIDVYMIFSVIFIIAFGIFVSSVSDGTRHGNMLSILYAIITMAFIIGIHYFVSPALFSVYL